MKSFMKFLGLFLVSIIAIAYIGFLFVLPRCIDLNQYTSLAKQAAKDSANLDINYENPKVLVTPKLELGVKADNLSVKLPDGSNVFSAEKVKAGVFLPDLFTFTINVSCAEIVSPKVNADIMKDGKQFKISRHIENLLNSQKTELSIEEKEVKEPTVLFNIGKTQITDEMLIGFIKIKVPNFKLKNYQANVNDLHTGHHLTLQGDKVVLGYFNGKTAKIKTDATLLSDNNVNIKANINVDTFLPPFEAQEEEEIDDAAKVVIPFVNPVELYRDYDLKVNVDSKLKIRETKDKRIKIKGYTNIDNLKVYLKGINLPESYAHFTFKGLTAGIDSNLYLVENQKIAILANLNYGKNSKLELNLTSDKILFKDCVRLAKSVLDTAKIKNNMNEIVGSGYLLADAKFKTDFKKIISDGSIIVRNGNISNKKHGKLIADINTDILLNENELKIKDTHANINNTKFSIKGSIDKNSMTDISVSLKNMPFKGFFLKILGYEAVKNLDIKAGTLSFDATLKGELAKLNTKLNASANNLNVLDKVSKLSVKNKVLNAKFDVSPETIDGTIQNNGLNVYLPMANSVLSKDNLEIKISKDDINIKPANIKFNRYSTITLKGDIKNYLKSPNIDIFLDGKISTKDLKRVLGREASFYIKSNGVLPVKVRVSGEQTKQDITAQILTDGANFITPININSIVGKQNIIQAKLKLYNDKLKISKTGLYSKSVATEFSNDLDSNILNAREVANIEGSIVSLSSNPYINIMRIKLNNKESGNICIFRNSKFNISGDTWIFGSVAAPIFEGAFSLDNLFIPQLKTKLSNATVNLNGNLLRVGFSGLLLNGSDVQLQTNMQIIQHTRDFVINNLSVSSKNIDLDKLMVIAERLTKFTPPAPKRPKKQVQTTNANIPLYLKGGSVDIQNLKTGNIVVKNLTARKMSIRRNKFYLDDVKAGVFDGIVKANVIVNLINSEIKLKSTGEKINADKMVVQAANMKDTISGTMKYKTELSFVGETPEQTMKSLKGYIDFEIVKGQLGPFGKIENLIMSENIRESAIFSNVVGDVIKNMATINTSHFDKMTSKITFRNGIMNIGSIGTEGDCLSLLIFGKYDLLKNTCEMKVRGRLASLISNMLGPIAMVNPINLIKNTPGLNVASAKAFALFCEEVTQEEFDAIPDFDDKLKDMNATKFQIVVEGDVAKPMKLLKSFKWLALKTDIDNANTFVSWLNTQEQAEANVKTQRAKEKIKAQQFDLETEKLKQAGLYQEPKKPNIFKRMFKKKSK